MNIIHERRAQRANDILRRPFRITGLTKFLGSLLILAVLSTTVQAASVTLAWTRSSDTNVAGYNVYYGGASGTYTNMVNVGSATNATISGLIPGTTYYFAATAYSSSGVGSPFSSEVSYTVPILPGVQLRVTPTRQFILTVNGLIGHTYDIQATQDFKTWTVIGTVTVGASGSLDFTDTNAASFSRRFYRTSEVSYTVPILPGVQLRITPTRQFILTVNGLIGHTYDIQATQDFKTWTVIGTVMVGASGSLDFTDTNAASFSRRFYRTSEVSYTVPILPGVQLRVTPTRQFILTVNGPIGHTYDIQATQDFKTWTVIGTVTVGASGSLDFTDTNAASFSRRFYRTRG
jgi:hypothetical protein